MRLHSFQNLLIFRSKATDLILDNHVELISIMTFTWKVNCLTFIIIFNNEVEIVSVEDGKKLVKISTTIGINR